MPHFLFQAFNGRYATGIARSPKGNQPSGLKRTEADLTPYARNISSLSCSYGV